MGVISSDAIMKLSDILFRDVSSLELSCVLSGRYSFKKYTLSNTYT
jgi:hypothetical protein